MNPPKSSVTKLNVTSTIDDTAMEPPSGGMHSPPEEEEEGEEDANSTFVLSEDSYEKVITSHPSLDDNADNKHALDEVLANSVDGHNRDVAAAGRTKMSPDIVANSSSFPTPSKVSRLQLTPPFRIAQLGIPRTGSTFQFRLLDLLARIKSPNGTEISTSFESRVSFLERLADGEKNSSFVVKSHYSQRKDLWKKFQKTGNGVVFASADLETRDQVEFADYIQLKENLVNCSLCEVDQYKDIFALSDDEVKLIKRYMGLYERIRMCCGMQMSKYNVMRLNGCDMTAYVDRPSYPHCEDYSMKEVEKEFDNLGLPFANVPGDDFKNWARPGDCDKFEKVIASGSGFNGEKFTSCEDALGEVPHVRIEGTVDKTKTDDEGETRQSTNGGEEKNKRSSVQERLNPPFRVVQLGIPRSGSTFQFRLLDVLVRMKSSPKENITTTFIFSKEERNKLLAGTSFVLKSHDYNEPEQWTKAQANRKVVVFASAGSENQHLVNFSDYVQVKENLENCSKCEIEKYKDLFGLTKDEIKLVETYMDLFEKIRKCCGTQMSKYNAMRLNGCNMTKYKERPSYPHCEDYDFEAIEREFDGLPLPYTLFPGYAKNNWVRPGDCAKFDKKMASGYLFMGERFTTCEAASTWRPPSPDRI